MSTAHDSALRFARQALPVADPAGALVMAQLATAHAVLTLVDKLDQQQTEKATRDSEAASELTIYRASHDSIVMGWYTNLEASQRHCEVKACIDIVGDARLDWIEDEEDGVFELVAEVDGQETPTGYVVTTLEVASEYDEEADE